MVSKNSDVKKIFFFFLINCVIGADFFRFYEYLLRLKGKIC